MPGLDEPARRPLGQGSFKFVAAVGKVINMEESNLLEVNSWPEEALVNFSSLDGADSEEPYMDAAFELLKEGMGLMVLACGLMPGGRGHERNPGILCGHLVRMMKISQTLIRMAAGGYGGEQQMGLSRQFMESAATILYLVADPGTGERFDAYVNDSLIAEKHLLRDIAENVEARGGGTLPIEERMRRSVRQTHDAAAVTEESIPARSKTGWPSAEKRIGLLGPDAYSAYRMGSGGIHGAWTELERRHLGVENGRFVPDLSPAPFRPQIFLTMGVLAVVVMREYLAFVDPGAVEVFGARLDSYVARVRRVDQLHENYLNS